MLIVAMLALVGSFISSFIAIKAYESSYDKHLKVLFWLSKMRTLLLFLLFLGFVTILCLGALGEDMDLIGFVHSPVIRVVGMIYITLFSGWYGAWAGSTFGHSDYVLRDIRNESAK